MQMVVVITYTWMSCSSHVNDSGTVLVSLAAIATYPDISEKIVRTELSYYRHTHRSDVIARPDLFKLNKVMW